MNRSEESSSEAWDAGVVPLACEASAGAAEVIGAADGGILYAEQSPELLAQALQVALRLPREETIRLVNERPVVDARAVRPSTLWRSGCKGSADRRFLAGIPHMSQSQKIIAWLKRYPPLYDFVRLQLYSRIRSFNRRKNNLVIQAICSCRRDTYSVLFLSLSRNMISRLGA